ncbi:hypothetical protein, partial [Oenococcus oeni]|uniref:hypothetical protein n=2 Tax=Oenococcus oeni TaxID=1247 RepID=UPI001C5AF1E5
HVEAGSVNGSHSFYLENSQYVIILGLKQVVGMLTEKSTFFLKLFAYVLCRPCHTKTTTLTVSNHLALPKIPHCIHFNAG